MKNLYVQIPDDIYDQLRTKSLKEKKTYKELVTEALSLYSFSQPQKEEKKADKNAGKTPIREKILGLVIEKKKDIPFSL